MFGDRPFPDAGVRARWSATLSEPGVTVLRHDHAFTSWDTGGRLRHLAVRPDHWGSGLGREAVALAVAGGADRLWVLDLNHRARRLYAHLGWRPTGVRRAAEWPPYPVELELHLAGSPHGG